MLKHCECSHEGEGDPRFRFKDLHCQDRLEHPISLSLWLYVIRVIQSGEVEGWSLLRAECQTVLTNIYLKTVETVTQSTLR